MASLPTLSAKYCGVMSGKRTNLRSRGMCTALVLESRRIHELAASNTCKSNIGQNTFFHLHIEKRRLPLDYHEIEIQLQIWLSLQFFGVQTCSSLVTCSSSLSKISQMSLALSSRNSSDLATWTKFLLINRLQSSNRAGHIRVSAKLRIPKTLLAVNLKYGCTIHIHFVIFMSTGRIQVVENWTRRYSWYIMQWTAIHRNS